MGEKCGDALALESRIGSDMRQNYEDETFNWNSKMRSCMNTFPVGCILHFQNREIETDSILFPNP
jgi:hypothetical protein